MEMKATRGQGGRFDENPAAEQQGDQSHGKKSVLKKVKEKAKKLKDSTIGKKKHREGEGGQPHEGEVREHGLPLDYMEEEEEVEEELEEEDEKGNFLGADPPLPGNAREKVGQSEPSAAVRPGIYKPPPPEGPDSLAGGSVMGLKDILNWPMLGSVEVSLTAGEQEYRPLDQGAGAKRSESRPFDEDPGAKRSQPGLLAPDIHATPPHTADQFVRGSEVELDVPEPGGRGTGVRPFNEDPGAKRVEPAVVSPDISDAADRKPAASEDDDLELVLESIKDLKFSEEFTAGSHDQFAPEPPAESGGKDALAKDAIAPMVHPKRDDEGVSATKYVMEKLSPGEEERALSEVIQDALHATTKVGDRSNTQALAKDSGLEAAAGGDRRGVVEKMKEVATSLVGIRDQAHDGGHQASDLGGEKEGSERKELQESTI